MSTRGLVVSMVLWATASSASDVLLEAGPAFTTSSEDNPRTGNIALNGSFDYSVGDAWELSASLQYVRDFATKTGDTSSNGSNIFHLALSAVFAPNEHWLTMLVVSGSPPSRQRNATTVFEAARNTDVVITSDTWSLGALWTGSYATATLTNFDSSFDAILAVNHYDVFQQADVPMSKQTALNTFCGTTLGTKSKICALANGASTPLFQARVGAAYTATLFSTTNLGLEGAYYLYDRDPSTVGYFSVVALGNATFGSGVPVLPLQFSLKPSVSHRFDKVTVRLFYQFGLYPDSKGNNQLIGVKVSLKVSSLLKFWVSGSGQFDLVSGGVVQNPGGNVMLGTMISW